MSEEDRDQTASKTSILAQLKRLAQKSRHHVQPAGNDSSNDPDEFETFVIDKPTSIASTSEHPAQNVATTDSNNPDAATTLIIDQPTSLVSKSQQPASPGRTPESQKTNRVNTTSTDQSSCSHSKSKQLTQYPEKAPSSHSNKINIPVAQPTRRGIPADQFYVLKVGSRSLDHEDVTTIFRSKEVASKPKFRWRQSVYKLLSRIIKGILRLILRLPTRVG